MYFFIKIRYIIHIQCHGNHIEMEKRSTDRQQGQIFLLIISTCRGPVFIISHVKTPSANKRWQSFIYIRESFINIRKSFININKCSRCILGIDICLVIYCLTVGSQKFALNRKLTSLCDVANLNYTEIQAIL